MQALFTQELIIWIAILVLFLGLILFRKEKIENKINKCVWLAVVVFSLSFVVLSGPVIISISLDEYYLYQHDFNNDGIFSGEELTPDQEEAMNKVINDAGSNLYLISTLFISIGLGLVTFFIALTRGIIKKQL